MIERIREWSEMPVTTTRRFLTKREARKFYRNAVRGVGGCYVHVYMTNGKGEHSVTTVENPNATFS